MTITLLFTATIVGLFLAWRYGAKCYDRGITDAILMHRNGRLKYNTYLDDNGSKMVNIEIDSLDE
jgi:hypothetical protein